MSEASNDFRATSFSKTSAGQLEIQSRSLRLAPLVRRLLVLIDGKRTGAELEAFSAGQDVVPLIGELLDQGLVSMRSSPAPVAVAVVPATNPSASSALAGTDWLAALPPAETRTEKELEMARNFMTNTVNNIFGHHNRISLIETIHGCKSTGELRAVYGMWASAMETHSAGHKRLPEFREKLFAVL